MCQLDTAEISQQRDLEDICEAFVLLSTAFSHLPDRDRLLASCDCASFVNHLTLNQFIMWKHSSGSLMECQELHKRLFEIDTEQKFSQIKVTGFLCLLPLLQQWLVDPTWKQKSFTLLHEAVRIFARGVFPLPAHEAWARVKETLLKSSAPRCDQHHRLVQNISFFLEK